jgi:filamentous hemagglutinin
MPDRLPNAERARIDPRKLRDYALNPQHISGQYKAAFFAQMGYAASDWQHLERDIREQHLAQPAEPGQASPYGRKFTITAPLQGPRGWARWVTTVWIFRPGNDFAELVTIEPAAQREAK